MKWYQKVWSWFAGGVTTVAKAVYELVASGVKSAATSFVNDPQNQQVAINAVRAAISEGLTGDKAWVAARDAMLKQFSDSAQGIADNWLDTLLQNAYFTVANSGE